MLAAGTLLAYTATTPIAGGESPSPGVGVTAQGQTPA
jgi:hypothetical protein